MYPLSLSLSLQLAALPREDIVERFRKVYKTFRKRISEWVLKVFVLHSVAEASEHKTVFKSGMNFIFSTCIAACIHVCVPSLCKGS